MAIFPQGLTQVDKRCNPGERRVLHALKRHLEDDYVVYHDIAIAPYGRQPDFLILHPSRGLLILEVKDWRISTVVDANPMLVTLNVEGTLLKTEHPLSQARGYAIEVLSLLKRDKALLQRGGEHEGQLILPWAHGAVLSHITRAQVGQSRADFDSVFPTSRVLLADDLQESVETAVFQQRLWSMFTVVWFTALTMPQLNLIRGHLFPELRMGAQQSLLPAPENPALVVQDLIAVMDLNQEEIARNLGEGHRVIHGAAGSGKTMILIFRALELQAAARPDKPILVLCYNKSLASRLDNVLKAKGAGPSMQVRTFHSWANELVRTYQLGKVSVSPQSPDYYEALTRLACEGVAAKRVPRGQYTAVLIDEAHDLKDEWLATAAKMVDPSSNSLLVLYDDAQSIYQSQRKRLNFSNLGIEAQGRTRILRVNYRNTIEVLALAVECARSNLEGSEEDIPGVSPQSGGRSGPLPSLHVHRSEVQQAQAVLKQVQQALANGFKLNEMVLLSRTKTGFAQIEKALSAAAIAYESQRDIAAGDMNWAAPCLKLLTLHSVKGLEFRWVAIINLQHLPHAKEPLEEELRLLYVGMTRATYELTLYAVGESIGVETVRRGLMAVNDRYR